MGLENKKILIIHDRFEFRGGAERLILIMARALKADIATEFWQDADTFPREQAPHRLYVLDTGNPRLEVYRYFRAQFNFLFKTRKFINDYDIVIFSGNNCITAAFNLDKNKPRLLYCHSPVRYVYDLFEYRRSTERAVWKRLVYYDIGKWGIRAVYRLGLMRFKKVLANSKNSQARLKRYCNRDSEIVYPPIMVEKFTWLGQGDYYLSFGRVDELKRIDDIVRAFQKMPDKKLKVISGGAQLAAIKALARGYNNIEVLGWVDNHAQELLVGNCIATIYIPMDEDFGMSPLEGMAAGKPCIGVAEGGLLETITPGKTGLLVPQDYQLDDLIQAIQELTPERAASMKDACIAQAQKFSEDRFVREMKSAISSNL